MDLDYLLTLAAAPIYAALAGSEVLRETAELRRAWRQAAVREAQALLADAKDQLALEKEHAKLLAKLKVKPRAAALPLSYSAAGVGGVATALHAAPAEYGPRSGGGGKASL